GDILATASGLDSYGGRVLGNSTGGPVSVPNINASGTNHAFGGTIYISSTSSIFAGSAAAHLHPPAWHSAGGRAPGGLPDSCGSDLYRSASRRASQPLCGLNQRQSRRCDGGCSRQQQRQLNKSRNS